MLGLCGARSPRVSGSVPGPAEVFPQRHLGSMTTKSDHDVGHRPSRASWRRSRCVLISCTPVTHTDCNGRECGLSRRNGQFCRRSPICRTPSSDAIHCDLPRSTRETPWLRAGRVIGAMRESARGSLLELSHRSRVAATGVSGAACRTRQVNPQRSASLALQDGEGEYRPAEQERRHRYRASGGV